MEDSFIIRVQYSKEGLPRFIGHLDTCRIVRRALRASGLPVRFTQGFNPEVKVSFGPPLPLGYSSECELFDVALDQAVTPAEVSEKLQRRLPCGITITKSAIFTYRPSALTRIIDHAQYRITLPAENFISPADIKKAIAAEADQSSTCSHIESLDCSSTKKGGSEFNVMLKGINRSAPSVTKIFATLLNIDLFQTDCARMHRVKLWSERQRVF